VSGRQPIPHWSYPRMAILTSNLMALALSFVHVRVSVVHTRSFVPVIDVVLLVNTSNYSHSFIFSTPSSDNPYTSSWKLDLSRMLHVRDPPFCSLPVIHILLQRQCCWWPYAVCRNIYRFYQYDCGELHKFL